jgi:hypothetical protein
MNVALFGALEGLEASLGDNEQRKVADIADKAKK